MKVLITGGGGYIARNLKPLFERAGYFVLAPTHAELDLMDRNALEDYLNKELPDVIVHTAAKGAKKGDIESWENIYVPNMRMYENLFRSNKSRAKIIIVGSGAEFDKRYNIQNALESRIEYEWPIDPYGLSKNIISKRAIADLQNAYVLRLFGCFNFDEDSTRFIKASILNLKAGRPIEIYQDREMDFFYLDDVFSVMHWVIMADHAPQNINLVYLRKHTLKDIAKIICKYYYGWESTFDGQIKINSPEWVDSYTGSGMVLDRLPIKLMGLERGIDETIRKLR